MSIKGTEGGDKLPPIEKQGVLASGPLAEQKLSSKEVLLSTQLERGGYRFHTIPLVGGVLKFLFGNALAKKSYVIELKKTFADKISGYGYKNPLQLADKILTPLKNCTLADLQLVERFFTMGGAPLFLFNSPAKNIELIRRVPEANLSALGKSFAFVIAKTSILQAGEPLIELTEMAATLSPHAFSHHVDSLKSVPNTVDPPKYNKLAAMISLKESLAQFFGKRFTLDEQKTYQQEWLNLASDKELSAEDFNSLAAKFQNYCKEVQQIQNERPTIYLAEEKKGLVDVGRGLQSELSANSRFLAMLSNDLIDRTVVINNQVLGENIGSFTKPPSMNNRTAPILDTRSERSYSLSREIHPDLTIYEDGDELIDLTGSTTRTLITDQETGETRSLHIPLPLAGLLSKTEARKLLRVLEATTHIAQDFDKEYEREKLPARLKGETKEAFLQWRDQAVRELYTLVLDFNATDSRPLFSFAREQSAVRRAIAEPKDEALALEAAKGGTLFLVEEGKTLSLLPPEIASNHPVTCQISGQTLEKVKKALIEGSEEPISIELPGGKGQLTLKQMPPQVLEENPVLWIEMTITQGNNSYTRKVLYLGESIAPYAQSGRLQRDLLLAKSEFLERVDRNPKSLAHLQPALKEFSPTDRAVILNFLLSLGGKTFVKYKEFDPKILLDFLKTAGGKIYAKVLADHPSNAIDPAALQAALRTNPQGIARAFETYPKVTEMMGNRFSEADHIEYMNAWIKVEPNDFQQAVELFGKYVEMAEEIQNQRPEVYGESERLNQCIVDLTPLIDDSPLLKDLVREIKNATIVSEHPVALNIKMLYDAEQMRSSPALERLDQDQRFSLSREITPLPNQDSTNFYVTNEKTMETRCVRIPLPKMPMDDRERYMDLLYTLMEQGPESFEKKIKALKLSSSQVKEIKQSYAQFVKEVREAMGKSVFDFNATRGRPAFSFVREEESMAKSIENPKSLPLQVNAAKRGNIFLLKSGSLSLLPQESANPQVGQITQEEFQQASAALSKNGTVQIALPTGEGDLHFASSEIVAKGVSYLHLETQVKQGVNENTRVSLYPLGNKKVAEKLQELAGSKHLEREILLAKSEFMHAHL